MWPKSLWEPCNKVGYLSLVKCLVGFELGTFWFWLKCLNPLALWQKNYFCLVDFWMYLLRHFLCLFMIFIIIYFSWSPIKRLWGSFFQKWLADFSHRTLPRGSSIVGFDRFLQLWSCFTISIIIHFSFICFVILSFRCFIIITCWIVSSELLCLVISASFLILCVEKSVYGYILHFVLCCFYVYLQTLNDLITFCCFSH